MSATLSTQPKTVVREDFIKALTAYDWNEPFNHKLKDGIFTDEDMPRCID